MMYLLNSLEEIQSHKHILIRMAYSKDLYCDVFFLGIPSQVLFTKNTNKGGFKKNIKQIADPIVLVVKFTLFTGALFSKDRKKLTIMGAKIMSQGVGGLRGILLIMGKEKELQEMEGSGLGETVFFLCL